MISLSDEIIDLIKKYERLYKKRPQPFWYTDWNSKEEYKKYLEKEIAEYEKYH